MEKTTLAKELSKSIGISYLSTDTLQLVAATYMTDETYREMFPTSSQRGKDNDEKYSKYSTEEIIDAYRKQSVSVFPAIEVFVECEISDQNDYILEGYHIESAIIEKLNRKYPGKIRSIVLVKTDVVEFGKNIQKSTTPNDWILARTHKEETFKKIAKMICDYGKIVKNEAEIYGVKLLHMDVDFNGKIQDAMKYLLSTHL